MSTQIPAHLDACLRDRRAGMMVGTFGHPAGAPVDTGRYRAFPRQAAMAASETDALLRAYPTVNPHHFWQCARSASRAYRVADRTPADLAEVGR